MIDLNTPAAPARAATVDQATPESAARARRLLRTVLAVMYYQGFAIAINGVSAPWIEKSFGLGQSGIATLYAWISLSAIGALVLSRLTDRIGRRRVLLGSMAATPLCALAAAASFSLPLFTFWEILLYACIGTCLSGSVVMLAEELPIAERAKGQSYGGLAMAFGSGGCIIAMPLLADAGYSWRWLLVAAVVAGLAALPTVARALPESQRWQRAAARYHEHHPLLRRLRRSASAPQYADPGLRLPGYDGGHGRQWLGLLSCGVGGRPHARANQRGRAHTWRRRRHGRLSARRLGLRAAGAGADAGQLRPALGHRSAVVLLGAAGRLRPRRAVAGHRLCLVHRRR
ncbi:MAG: MFS transporter [Deltaproteobacteria bacterium]|nr:MFS transporter [Deltaproteobacteria bacterium]